MAWSLLAAGFCFFIPIDSSARVPLVALFIFIFAGSPKFSTPGNNWSVPSFLFPGRRSCSVYLFCRGFPSHSSRGGHVRWSSSFNKTLLTLAGHGLSLPVWAGPPYCPLLGPEWWPRSLRPEVSRYHPFSLEQKHWTTCSHSLRILCRDECVSADYDIPIHARNQTTHFGGILITLTILIWFLSIIPV